MYTNQKNNKQIDMNKLEFVTTCVGFDDIINITLKHNIAQVDTAIVVTSHSDYKTQSVAKKYGAICVQTDLFKKNNRAFNKGAAINVGFDRWHYNSWRMHIDSDIILPDNFRRMIFNHTSLHPDCIYGADRINILPADLTKISSNQYHDSAFLSTNKKIESRYICPLRGYIPIGFFQMWNHINQHPYPYSLGTAAHDDVMFAASWPEENRRLLPTIIVYHLVTKVDQKTRYELGRPKTASNKIG